MRAGLSSTRVVLPEGVRPASVLFEAGRIVIVGSSSPYTAYLVPGGSWTAGGTQPGGSLGQVLYSPNYGGFITARTTNIWRSVDATAWASVATGVANGVQSIAAASVGSGLVVALDTATTPAFRRSSNAGASFIAAATVSALSCGSCELLTTALLTLPSGLMVTRSEIRPALPNLRMSSG